MKQKQIDLSQDNIIRKFISYFILVAQDKKISKDYQKKLLEGLCQGFALFYGLYTAKIEKTLSWNDFLAMLANWDGTKEGLQKNNLRFNFELAAGNILFFQAVKEQFIEQKYPYGYNYEHGERLLKGFKYCFSQNNLFKPKNRYFQLLGEEILFETSIAGHFTSETLKKFFSLSNVFDLSSAIYTIENFGHIGGFRVGDRYRLYPVNHRKGEKRDLSQKAFIEKLLKSFGHDLIIRVIEWDKEKPSNAKKLLDEYFKTLNKAPAEILTTSVLNLIIKQAPELLNVILSADEKNKQKEKIQQTLIERLHDNDDELLQYLYDYENEILNSIALKVPFYTIDFFCDNKNYTIACLKQKPLGLQKLMERISKIFNINRKYINLYKINGGLLTKRTLRRLNKKIADIDSLSFDIEYKMARVDITFDLDEKTLNVHPLSNFCDFKAKIKERFKINDLYYYDIICYDQVNGALTLRYIKTETDFKNFLSKADLTLSIHETALFKLRYLNKLFRIRPDEIAGFDDLVEKIKSHFHLTYFELFNNKKVPLTDENFIPNSRFFHDCLNGQITIEEKIQVECECDEKHISIFYANWNAITLNHLKKKIAEELKVSSNSFDLCKNDNSTIITDFLFRQMSNEIKKDKKFQVLIKPRTIKVVCEHYKYGESLETNSIEINVFDSLQDLKRKVKKAFSFSDVDFKIIDYTSNGNSKIMGKTFVTEVDFEYWISAVGWYGTPTFLIDRFNLPDFEDDTNSDSSGFFPAMMPRMEGVEATDEEDDFYYTPYN
jgi:hypothetical protein